MRVMFKQLFIDGVEAFLLKHFVVAPRTLVFVHLTFFIESL